MVENTRWTAVRERLAAARRERDELIDYIVLLERELEATRDGDHYMLGVVEHCQEHRDAEGNVEWVLDIREADGALWRTILKTRGPFGSGQLIESATKRLPSKASPNHPTLAHRWR